MGDNLDGFNHRNELRDAEFELGEAEKRMEEAERIEQTSHYNSQIAKQDFLKNAQRS